MDFEPGDLSLKPFDAADYIRSEDDIRDFLEAALYDTSPAEMVRAVKTVMRAKAMMILSQQTGLSREQLADTLNSADQTNADNLATIYLALGVDPTQASNAAE